jgi:CheY-like chemotaxis protein
MDGWQVLDRLKHDVETRHIPVCVITVADERQRGLEMGAFAWGEKPITHDALEHTLTELKAFVERRVRNLLVVEDDQNERTAIVELIGNGDVVTKAVGTGEEALAALEADRVDCLVLDLGLPDMPGVELIRKIRDDRGLVDLPIIIYTGRDLTREEETALRKVTEGIIVKNVRSPERLLEETSLFLHREERNIPEPKRKMLEQYQQTDPVLAGRKVLIVDDDVRNIFALTSALERRKMKVVYAESGRGGLDLLKANEDVDVVLMDVMMPDMDGYETMRALRSIDQFKQLPVIALTAKAMKMDREKCIEAGASDYITKPVDLQQLLSLLRVWLYR